MIVIIFLLKFLTALGLNLAGNTVSNKQQPSGMIAENTIRKQIQRGKQQKIIAAVHLFFKHKDFKDSKVDIVKQETTIVSGNNYYFEQENWVFRERARHNSIIFFDQLAPLLSNTHTASEQKMEYLILKYVELLFEKPDFAAYLITDLMSSPNEKLLYHIRNQRKYQRDRFFVSKTGDLNCFKSFAVIINLIGMVLLPFVMIYSPENHEDSQFNEFENLIEQRKKLLPLWIKSALEKL